MCFHPNIFGKGEMVLYLFLKPRSSQRGGCPEGGNAYEIRILFLEVFRIREFYEFSKNRDLLLDLVEPFT